MSQNTTPEWLEDAIKLYTQDKLSYAQIGNLYGVGRKTVSKYLRNAGVKSNPKYVTVSTDDAEKFRKYDYSVADHIFDNIDTEEKAYWLGFLYADGYVASERPTIELSLQESDYKTVEKFRIFVGLEEKPISKKVKHMETGDKVSYRFSFNSQSTKEALIKLGCFENKSTILKFPTNEQVPEDLLYHFIRGYMDGDGCIYVAPNKIAVEFVGTEDFLTKLKEFVNLGHGKVYDVSNKSNAKRTMYTGVYALEFLKRIYCNATIYLERKFNKYQEYLAHQEGDHIAS